MFTWVIIVYWLLVSVACVTMIVTFWRRQVAEEDAALAAQLFGDYDLMAKSGKVTIFANTSRRTAFLLKRSDATGLYTEIAPENVESATLNVSIQTIDGERAENYTVFISLHGSEKADYRFSVIGADAMMGWRQLIAEFSEVKSSCKTVPTWRNFPKDHFQAGFDRALRLSLIRGVVVLSLAALGHYWLFYASPAEQAEARKAAEQERQATVERVCTSSAQSFGHSKQFIRDALLESPERIEKRRSSYLGNCRHLIVGSVVGRNAFGSVTENYFMILMEFDRDSGVWYGAELVIDSSRKTIDGMAQAAGRRY